MEPLSIQTFTIDDFKTIREQPPMPTPLPALFRRCNDPIAATDAWKYVHPLSELLRKEGGLGLAANQVGLSIPLFVFMFEDEIIPVFRPTVVGYNGNMVTAREGCLSFPGVRAKIYRRSSVTVEFIAQKNNKRRQLELHGTESRTFQHELDHLDGLVILDHLSSLDEIEPVTLV